MAKSKKLSKYLSSPIVLAIAYILIGILFCVKKAAIIEWIMIIAGVLFIAQGVIDWLVGKDLKTGVIEIVIGVVLILFGALIVDIAMIVLGVALIIKSVVAILSLPKNIMVTVYNIVTLLIGILLIVANYLVLNWLFIIIGVAFIINGVLTLFGKK